jgi:hypothetical protein
MKWIPIPPVRANEREYQQRCYDRCEYGEHRLALLSHVSAAAADWRELLMPTVL